MIILVAAISEDNAIGNNNQLLWHLPNDLKRFKALTLNNYIIMGRKTFDSLPGKLPNRTHVVISRNNDLKLQDVIVVNSLEKALAVVPYNQDAYIIGGGEIYKQALPFADKLEITKVIGYSGQADTYFPVIDSKYFELISEEYHIKDEKHLYDYSFQTYQKKS